MMVPYQSARQTRPGGTLGVVLLVVVCVLVLAIGGVVVQAVTRGRGNASLADVQRGLLVAVQRGELIRRAQEGASVAPHVQARTPMEELALQAARSVGITDTLALAVMEQESGGSPQAVSTGGARGLFQVMPETGAGIARDLGVANYTPTLLDDPEINAQFGMYYLDKQIQRYGLIWGLAAYNWGPGAVGQFLAAHPRARTQSWEAVLAQYSGAIPAETQQYVASILAIEQRVIRERTPAETPAPAVPTMPATPATTFPVTNQADGVMLVAEGVTEDNDVVVIHVRAISVQETILQGTALTVADTAGRVTPLPAGFIAPVAANTPLDLDVRVTRPAPGPLIIWLRLPRAPAISVTITL